jgi:hypothetical protein
VRAVSSCLAAAIVGIPFAVPFHEPVARWTVSFAEQQLRDHPPSRWQMRQWDVVWSDCDGRGGPSKTRRSTTFRNFDCEITIVKPSSQCPSSGIYVCVSAAESTVIQRTLHVIDARRYALYRTA